MRFGAVVSVAFFPNNTNKYHAYRRAAAFLLLRLSSS